MRLSYSDLCQTPLRNVYRLGKFLGADVERRPSEPAAEYVRRLRGTVAMACAGRMLVDLDEVES